MENSNDELEQFGPYIKKPESKLKKTFITIWATIFTILLYASVAYFEFGGIYHAWKKHNDAVLAFFIPPLAWYRAVEVFWHNDFAGVNWEERLQGDARACIYFLKTSAEPSGNYYEFDRSLKKYSKEISNYPKDRLMTLKTLSKLFLEYYMTLYEDFEKAATKFFNSGELGLSHSGKILEIENNFKQFLPQEYCEQLVKETELNYKQFDQQLTQSNGFNDTQKSNFLQNLKTYKTISKSYIYSTYKKLFGEELL